MLCFCCLGRICYESRDLGWRSIMKDCVVYETTSGLWSFVIAFTLENRRINSTPGNATSSVVECTSSELVLLDDDVS
jgi:hypothetical protein